MTYNIIATGSDGNAVVINHSVLIDCGVTWKALLPCVKEIQLVFLTHIHGDHFNAATIKRLAYERPAIRFVCCEWMVKSLLEAGVRDTRIDVVKPGTWAAWTLEETVYASPVKLTHNVENCGWRFSIAEETLFYATDTGTLDGINVKDYDLYLVEANHTRADLEARLAEKEAAGEYAYERRAAENHLSMEQAIDWLSQNMATWSVWVPMHGHREGGADLGRETDVCEDDRAV